MDSLRAEPVSQIQTRIKEKVGAQRYRVWFKNSTRLSLANGFLKVGVPNLFVGGWIENHFTETISTAAREITGRNVHVTFSIDPQLFGALPKRHFDSQAAFIAAANPEQRVRLPKPSAVRPGTAANRPLRGRLEAFVVGPSNRMAYNAALSVVEAPATRYNPLFVHGGCGLGKTHLLQGICNALTKRNAQCCIQYVSGEEFTNQYIYAMRTRRLDSFRHQFRHLDVLVIDDIHFLSNKKATQEEFLHTFNAIDGYGNQVVMASDAHPKLIGQLSEKLVTRFMSGMVVRIDVPDVEMRCKILRQRAAAMERTVPDPVIAYIAENVEGNVRELEGALLNLVAFSTMRGEPITVHAARVALEDHLLRTAPIMRVSDIEAVVATRFGLTPADLHTSRKTRSIALARNLAMYLARKHTSMSYPEIGRFMGKKNHSTVILACRKIQRLLDTDGTVTWVNAAGKEEMRVKTLLGSIEEQLGKTARQAQP